MCNAGAQSSSNYINQPPSTQPGMSTKQKDYGTNNQSENSSLTAVDEQRGQIMPGISLSTSPSSSPSSKDQTQPGKTKYEQWYPGDASNNGRPSWWNKLFCCGYGLGCLLCPCSSWNCKYERS